MAACRRRIDLVEATVWYLIASKQAGKKRKAKIKKKIIEMRKTLTTGEFREAMERYEEYKGS